MYHKTASKKVGPRLASTVRFVFEIEELYSQNMKEREDEKVALQKKDTANGGKSSK